MLATRLDRARRHALIVWWKCVLVLGLHLCRPRR
jgi:hypothetical protein